MRLQPKTGDVFHYKITTKSQVSIKNSNDLFTEGEWMAMKPNDKASTSLVFFITLSVRSRRADEATDFKASIDSIHGAMDNNGLQGLFTSTSAADKVKPDFAQYSVLTGYDFGAIYDSKGAEKDVYGYYNVVDNVYASLPDSLQTDDENAKINDQVHSALQTNLGNLFTSLPYDEVGKDSSYANSYRTDYPVWSSLSFPMQTDYSQRLSRFEEQGGRTYGIWMDSTSLIPIERIIDEKEYKTTLPTFTYVKKNVHYIDLESGMIGYSKLTMDRSFSMKIEGKGADKEGKSYVTVQRLKEEAVVELMK